MYGKCVYLLPLILMQVLVSNASGQVGKGNILFEYYYHEDTGNGWDLNVLLNYPGYPDNPDASEWRTLFEGQTDWRDGYGTRVRGYLYPPQTGDYTFWIATDDQSQLWLSTDDTPEKAVQIASVPGWVPSRDFDNTGGGSGGPEQKSKAITLQSGKKYYIWAIMSEGGGGDNLAVAWQGPGIASRAVIEGKYLSPVIRPIDLMATNPSPADGATGVLTPLCQWTAGKTAQFHEVYFGTNPTPGAAELRGRQPFNVYWHAAGLTPGATYYWRIDEVDPDGVTVHTGEVWSFTAAGYTAHTPNPKDGAKYVDLDADLSWGAGVGATAHDVYFGTSQADVAAGTGGTFKAKVSLATYDPGTMKNDMTYYWRIDEYDSAGKKYPGAVWSFATISANAGFRCEFFNGMELKGAPILSRIDPVINFYWGSGVKPYPELPSEDNFSVRWTAALEAPYTERYVFVTGSDDGVRLYLDGQLIIDNWTDHDRTVDVGTPVDLVAGQTYLIVLEGYENGGEAEWQLYWQSASIPREVVPAWAVQLPLRARNPRPANGETDVKHTPTLRWSPGEKAAKHNVYFGTDASVVENATTGSAGIYRGQQDLKATSYAPTEAPLAWNKTYYWRIDEVNGVDVWKGSLWSFTTANFIVVDDFEDYTDDLGSRIFQTWKDGLGFSLPAPGYPGNGTGSAVGNSVPPYAEQTVIHGGAQSMPLTYDNSGTGGKARYSETFREWTTPQDWTVNNVKALTLYVQGNPPDFLESPPGTYTMSAEGSDIWGGTDEFRYMYKQLSGDGEIIAKVVSIGGPGNNEWRKAGVMIRETLDGASKHAFMAVTPLASHGLAFQYRDGIQAGDSDSEHGVDNKTAPYWVKLVRKGNVFTGYHSPDGVTWTMKDPSGAETDAMNPVTITMAANIYIGLALTSHQNDVLCVAQFSNVSTAGSVTGAWTVADIASTVTGTNTAEPLYVAVEDNTGKVKVVNNANPGAAVQTDWQEWNIDLKDFSGAGVNLKAVKKMYIGLGIRPPGVPKAGGTGKIYIDDIRVYPSRCIPSLGKPAADLSGNCVVDYADLDIMAGQWLQTIPPAAALSADLNADKKVNFKDFAVLADAWLEQLLWP